MHFDELRTCAPATHRFVVEYFSGILDFMDTGGVSRDLLLLPEGLLSLLFLIASRVRRARCIERLLRRDALSVPVPKCASLLFLSLFACPGFSLVGCIRCVSVPRRLRLGN